MDVEDVVKEVDVGRFGGAGVIVVEVELGALLSATSGGGVGGVGGELATPPGPPVAACTAGCSISAYRHTGHVPLVLSHVTMQSSWKA